MVFENYPIYYLLGIFSSNNVCTIRFMLRKKLILHTRRITYAICITRLIGVKYQKFDSKSKDDGKKFIFFDAEKLNFLFIR